jgi:hypothetical protein
VAVAVDLEPFEERLVELDKQPRTQRGVEARELFRRFSAPGAIGHPIRRSVPGQELAHAGAAAEVLGGER